MKIRETLSGKDNRNAASSTGFIYLRCTLSKCDIKWHFIIICTTKIALDNPGEMRLQLWNEAQFKLQHYTGVPQHMRDSNN